MSCPANLQSQLNSGIANPSFRKAANGEVANTYITLLVTKVSVFDFNDPVKGHDGS